MSDAVPLPKYKRAALEKVFGAEIRGRMLQSKARIYALLEEEEYVKQTTEIYGAGERFPVTATGWVLTHKGRIVYCESCGPYDESDDEAMVMLRCPNCHRAQQVARDATDPPETAIVQVRCPECVGGDFDEVLYFDVHGCQLGWE